MKHEWPWMKHEWPRMRHEWPWMKHEWSRMKHEWSRMKHEWARMGTNETWIKYWWMICGDLCCLMVALLCWKLVGVDKERRWTLRPSPFLVVALPGLEPGNAAPKTVVLPLHYKAILIVLWTVACRRSGAKLLLFFELQPVYQKFFTFSDARSHVITWQ